MRKIHRRHFLKQLALTTGGTFALTPLPAGLFAQARAADIPIGFQTWVVREQLAADFKGTLETMAGQGYRLVEMCSPKGYEKAGFGPLVKMKVADMRRIIADAGLNCPSCHFGMSELNEHLDDRISFAQELGLSEMICSSFGLPKTATLNDYLIACDQLNNAGEKIKKAGMQAGFHNHSTEFTKLDGKLIYDEMLKRLDPDLVKMQFQTEVINLGYKASNYFKKYPGRYVSAHLSDWTADKKEVPIGQGIINWKEFFAAAKTAGVKHYFVEMTPNTLKDSAEYIKQM